MIDNNLYYLNNNNPKLFPVSYNITYNAGFNPGRTSLPYLTMSFKQVSFKIISPTLSKFSIRVPKAQANWSGLYF